MSDSDHMLEYHGHKLCLVDLFYRYPMNAHPKVIDAFMRAVGHPVDSDVLTEEEVQLAKKWNAIYNYYRKNHYRIPG